MRRIIKMKNIYLENENGKFVNIGLNGNSSTVSVSEGIDTTITAEYELKLTKEQKKELKNIKTTSEYADFINCYDNHREYCMYN